MRIGSAHNPKVASSNLPPPPKHEARNPKGSRPFVVVGGGPRLPGRSTGRLDGPLLLLGCRRVEPVDVYRVAASS